MQQRPAHAVWIASIAAEWTHVEQALTRLLGGAYGHSLHDKDGPQSIEHHPVAIAAMRAAETIRTRLKLLDMTVAELVEGTSLATEWVELRTALGKRSKERNAVVHGQWGVAPVSPLDLVQLNADGSYTRWTEQDLKHVHERIVACRWQVILMTTAIMKAVFNKEIPERGFGPKAGPVQA